MSELAHKVKHNYEAITESFSPDDRKLQDALNRVQEQQSTEDDFKQIESKTIPRFDGRARCLNYVCAVAGITFLTGGSFLLKYAIKHSGNSDSSLSHDEATFSDTVKIGISLAPIVAGASCSIYTVVKEISVCTARSAQARLQAGIRLFRPLQQPLLSSNQETDLEMGQSDSDEKYAEVRPQ